MLLDDPEIDPDEIRQGLAKLRANPKLGPGVLSSLVNEIRQLAAHPELAPGAPTAGSKPTKNNSSAPCSAPSSGGRTHMTPAETVLLVAYVKACCPQQAIGEYTPDAWHDLLGDLDLADCKEAVAGRGQTPAVRRRSGDPRRGEADPGGPAGPHAAPGTLRDAADQPGRYQQIVAANVKRIADGLSVQRAIGAGAPLPGDPPAEWQQARESLKLPEPDKPDPQEVALEQVKEARAKREGRESGSRRHDRPSPGHRPHR